MPVYGMSGSVFMLLCILKLWCTLCIPKNDFVYPVWIPKDSFAHPLCTGGREGISCQVKFAVVNFPVGNFAGTLNFEW